jgi:serine phosphatase RsbU (regulator of sigma subunit)
MCIFSLLNNLLFLVFLLQSYGKKKQVPSFFLVFRLAICDSILVLRQTPIPNRFSVAEKVLPFDNSNKKLDFCFVLCSLIRTFVALMENEMKRGLRSMVVIVAMIVIVTTLFSCDKTQREELKAGHADSLIFAAGAVMQYDRLLTLVDSFDATGDINKLDAYRWRGAYYYHQNQYRMAEVCFRNALDYEVKTDFDQLVYNKVVRRLSELLVVRGDYEGALQIAVPAIGRMDKTGIGSDIDYAILYNNMGVCQLNLRQEKEAKESFLKARDRYNNRCETDSTSRGYQEAVLGTVYTSMAYINTRRYEESISWIDRTEQLLDKYRQRSDARKQYFDEYQGRIEIMRATALQGLGKNKEAYEAYKRFKTTAFSETGVGRVHGNGYLVSAMRYREAADNYRFLDKAIQEQGLEPTLDVIQLYMLPKYRANYEAHREDSARRMGMHILSLLDTAITTQKLSASAELATIYHTNEKEAEIARQHAQMSNMQMIGGLIALGLIIVFLLFYTFYKRKSEHRLRLAHEKLEDTHQKLKVAYDQLEETTQAKERIESELRIARNIQMSMVPNTFPTREGLDMYASMTPAREVGGDLYGYVMIDDELYFCVGDVSGKGVPASLFMAQATRLFRILATQHMMPAEIATRMNSVLTESNEQGMFITMFIGLVNLETGRLDYCNAGHNPPVLGIDGDDHFMEMESNAPIGLWPNLEFVGEYVDSIRQKLLLVYTDGLNEAENLQQEQFGEDRLLDILNHRHFNSCRELVEHLNVQVANHRNGADPNDDLTMMCLMVL